MSISTYTTRHAGKGEQGFTLIELSIVLVIIGLIVGGILTGQDLIKSAEQRATLAQIEKYNTAVNTFRNKFGGLPGDLAVGSATNFGLFAIASGAPCATAGAAGCGDGNGLVEGANSNSLLFEGEILVFFRHLGDAGLVDGSFAQTGAVAGTITANAALGADTTSAAIASVFPLAKLGRANYISPAANGGINYFMLTGMGSSGFKIAAAGGALTNGTNNLTPIESYSMDKKVDDGMPESGSIVAIDAATTPISTSITSSPIAACLSGTNYQLSASLGGNTPACSLKFRFN